MTDLTEFVRARLDEDAAAARLAAGTTGGRWTHPDTDTQVGCVMDHSSGLVIVYDEGAPDRDEAAHIARHDPARVLAEVASKRRILDEVVPEMDSMTSQIHGEWGVGTMDPSTYESLGLLRLLALPYADHPDYREEWRP